MKLSESHDCEIIDLKEQHIFKIVSSIKNIERKVNHLVFYDLWSLWWYEFIFDKTSNYRKYYFLMIWFRTFSLFYISKYFEIPISTFRITNNPIFSTIRKNTGINLWFVIILYGRWFITWSNSWWNDVLLKLIIHLC